MPTSNTLATKYFGEHGSTDPLSFLTEWEKDAAVFYVSQWNNPDARWGTHLRTSHFHDPLIARGISKRYIHRLFMNPAWVAYTNYLKTQTREAVMGKLKSQAFEVVDDYEWSRQEARRNNDYKETRIAASDHLDRIGATERPQPMQAQQVTVVLKSRNFTEEEPLRQLPAVEAEEVVDVND